MLETGNFFFIASKLVIELKSKATLINYSSDAKEVFSRAKKKKVVHDSPAR